mgnify:CR=1 FL=1
MDSIDKKISKTRIVSGILTGIGSLVTIISIIFLVINYSNTKRDLQKKNQLLNDSIEKCNQLELQNAKEKLVVLNTIQKYLIATHEKKMEAVDSFFKFPVEKYYTCINVSIDKFNERTRYYWNHHSDSIFIINKSNTEITKQDSIFVVKIKQSETNKGITYLNIKLNKEMKIIYVSNTILVNVDPDE